MRYILFILLLTGGLLSFNSFASNCHAGIKIPSGTYSPVINGVLGSDIPFSINIHGCEYTPVDINYIVYTEGPLKGSIFSSNGFISTGNVIKTDNTPDDSDSDNPDTKPDDKPDVTPPVIDVKPPKPDTGTTGSSGFAAALSSINSSSAESLYLSYPFDYNFNFTLEQNEQLAKAFLSKLSNVTPPSYYAVEHIKSMMDDWQKTYSYMRPSDAGPYYLWKSSKFVSGEHRYTGQIVLAVYNCAEPDNLGNCYDEVKPLVINDPDYASLNDYKNGVTRCMRNPNDPFCHSSGGDSSGGSGDTSGNHNVDIPGTGGSSPDTGDKPDNCPSGSHHEPGALEGSCTTDLTPNPGAGGGSGSGSTDNNDNGDVVAAINAFHADANKNHQETMDTFTNLPQETPDLIEGYLSPKLNSIIDGMKKEMTDDYNDALAEFKDVFGDIDSYIPDIKLSFDLPVQFTNGISGRCVPLVFDFNIALIGFQPYHFHAEGVQACQLYDTYIRSIVEYMLYFLTALACRRVFTRAAEFITSRP